jgi:ribosome-associated toxin RatA of RatAB toxin-antitoxin module
LNRKLAFFLTCILFSPIAARASDIDVQVTPEGPNLHRVVLHSTLQAPASAVWSLLTDYNHHAHLLPYMTESRVISEHPKRVHQVGRIRVLFWTFELEVTQQVDEKAPHEMRFRAVDGDFKRLEGIWSLGPVGTGTSLSCNFRVEPKRRVPTWAVRFTARHYLAKMIQTLAEHAQR